MSDYLRNIRELRELKSRSFLTWFERCRVGQLEIEIEDKARKISLENKRAICKELGINIKDFRKHVKPEVKGA